MERKKRINNFKIKLQNYTFLARIYNREILFYKKEFASDYNAFRLLTVNFIHMNCISETVFNQIKKEYERAIKLQKFE